MKCQDFRELIDSYLSNELLTETNHSVLHHLEQCPDCRFVIEERREFRGRLRSAVQNCREYTICENFNTKLNTALRHSAIPPVRGRKAFWSGMPALAGAAAGLVLIAAVGFFFVGNVGELPRYADSSGKNIPAYFQQIALEDHKTCAVEHALEENPIGIDLSEPQYASLKAAVQLPLKDKFGRCELVDAHTCRYQGHTFTHLVFQPEGKTMSVLIVDLPERTVLKADYIAKLSLEGYQIAHFDVDQKAVFVISDLPESQNFSAAEIVETPLRQKLRENGRAGLVSLADYEF